MSRCEQCGYQWPDVDEEGNLISAPYCHFEGPDGWAPCEQDEYEDEYDEAIYTDYLDMLSEEEECAAQEGFYNRFEQPYDYKEF